MANEAVKARAILRIGDGTTTPGDYGLDTFTEIPNVLNVSGLGPQKSEIEVTNMQSVVKEYVSDTPDAGTVDFELHYESETASHNELRAAANAVGKVYNWEIEHQIPSGGGYILGMKFQFYGECMTFSHDWSSGDAAKVSASVKVSSAVTEVAA